MNKGLFITGTGTDVGKTYITALLIKKLREHGTNCGYYKAAISGANSIGESDAGYVNRMAKINQVEETLLSYLYKSPVSPHLAAQIEGNPVDIHKVYDDYLKVCNTYDRVVVEGSGGIVCPIRFDEIEQIMLYDIVKLLNIPSLIVADAGLGTINSTVLTIEYLKQRKLPVAGVILNHYCGNRMKQDNIKMIEQLTNIKVIGTVEENATSLDMEVEHIVSLFECGGLV